MEEIFFLAHLMTGNIFLSEIYRPIFHGWPDILPKDTLPKDILPKDILPNGHFADGRFAERTFCRTDILPNGHFAERTVCRTDNLPKIEISSELFKVQKISLFSASCPLKRFAYTVKVSVIKVIVRY